MTRAVESIKYTQWPVNVTMMQSCAVAEFSDQCESFITQTLTNITSHHITVLNLDTSHSQQYQHAVTIIQ